MIFRTALLRELVAMAAATFFVLVGIVITTLLVRLLGQAAAGAITITAVQRLLVPRPLERVGLGLVVAGVAALVNLVVALFLRNVGRKRRSIALEADGQHLLTDVWTTLGVVVGVSAASWTGWQPPSAPAT